MATRKTAARKSTGKKTASRKKSPARPRDALALLKADHKKVDELFKQFEKARSTKRKQDLASEICLELTVHAEIEEMHFYPALRKAGNKKLAELLDEANVEHQSLKTLIAQIEQGPSGDDLYDAKVTVLGEYVKHHVKEEEGEIFALARKTRLDLKALGETLSEEKEALLQSTA